MESTIAILLTLYNGEMYLREQIDSIFRQTHPHWKLYIRDDGSYDNSMQIIKDYQLLYPNKIEILQDYFGNIGSTKSFMLLLDSADSQYFMFCDQDDVWLPDKIKLSLAKMEELEKSYGKDTPLLVFTDMMVVDSNLKVIHNSFWQYQKLNPNITKDWRKLLAQNVITGCAIIINQAAKKVSLPLALDGVMHDQWIGVNVAKHGKIGYIRTVTLLYRQHTANAEGAHQFQYQYIAYKLKNIKTLIQKLHRAASFFREATLIKLLLYKVQSNLERLFK